jgi:hypothetical protein
MNSQNEHVSADAAGMKNAKSMHMAKTAIISFFCIISPLNPMNQEKRPNFKVFAFYAF